MGERDYIDNAGLQNMLDCSPPVATSAYRPVGYLSIFCESETRAVYWRLWSKAQALLCHCQTGLLF